MRDSSETLEQFRERLAKNRLRLLKIEPLISYLSLEIPTYLLLETEAKQIGVETAATNGSAYYFNFNWCRRLTDPELIFVIAHEVAHVLGAHFARRNGRELKRWNAACDYVINQLIVDSLKDQVIMPRDPEPIGLLDIQYSNHTAEQVYDQLAHQEVKSNWDQLIQVNLDDIAGAKANSCSAVARAIARTKEFRHRNGQGNIPSEWERIAAEGMHPTVNWRCQLQMHAAINGQDTYTWTCPNKKLLPHGYYLPRYQGFQLLKTLFVFDTSGSIEETFLGQMAAELNHLLTLATRSFITVASCDTDLHILGQFSAQILFIPSQHKLLGGGGTNFREPFKYAATNRFEQIIYLTDTLGLFPESPVRGLKTIWLVPEIHRHNIPFGITIPIPFISEKNT